MSKFKILMKKDFWIHKKNFFVPIWIMAALYLLSLIAVVVAYFKSGVEFNIMDLEFGAIDVPVLGISYFVNLALIGFPSLLCILTAVMLAQSALNEDSKRNFELFHRSQPVSVWARSGSKFLVTIGGTWVVLTIITLFNSIIMNSVLAYFHFFSFSGALQGVLQGMIAYIKMSLVLGSICFFASSIFKDKALLNTLGILIGVQVLFLVINLLYGIHLPLPFNYLKGLMETNARSFEINEFAQQDAINIIKFGWQEVLFNWKTLLQLGFSGVMFAGATFIYKNKEIK